MASNVAVGVPLKVAEVKRGTASDGHEWEMLLIKDETKGKRDMSIFVENRPSGATKGGTVIVETITSVKYGARKDSKGYYHDAVAVNAVIRSAASKSKPDRELPAGPSEDLYSGIMEDIIDDDGELPW